MSKKDSFLVNRLKSVGIAAKGALLLIKNEASIKVQVMASILVTCAGFYFDISKTEWLIQLLAIGLVLGTESINSAVEEIADFIHPNHHTKIGYIKDVAAGAVFFAGTIAIFIAMIIYIPKI